MARSNRWLPVCLIPMLASSVAVADDVSPDAARERVASERALAQEDRILELERTVRVLADELARTRADIAVPEEPTLTPRYGRGPAASGVYGVARGISLGGYGEAYYRNIVSDSGSGTGKKLDSTDMLRAVVYMGYKFSENIVFNSEIEFEHATTESTITSGDGSVSVEFAYLDFFWKDWANFRSGLVLLPMGFLNEVHEPPFFFGVNRPEVERQIIPTTWRENGVGLFGRLCEELEYELYVVNGLNAEGITPSGLRDARQSGNRALAENLAVTGKLDWTPIPGLLLGGSFFLGDTGQDQTLARFGGGPNVHLPETFLSLWEVHSQYESHGLHLRGLFTMANIDDAGSLTRALQSAAAGSGTVLGPGQAIGGEMMGVYGEIAYELMQWLFPESEKTLTPFYRYEWYDTQRDMPGGFGADRNQDRQIHTLGIQYKPIASVVLKLDWRKRSAKKGQVEDEINLGMGYAF